MKKNMITLIGFCSLAFVACAGQKPPVEAMTKANITVKNAEKTNAAEAAPLEMRLAREKLDQAEKDMSQKNYTSAKNNADDATIQAELAESKKGLKDTQLKTKDAEQGLKTLKNEIQHNNQGDSK